MTTFAELGLAEPIRRALESEGYEQPTPIQRAAIPALLGERDLLGIAQTGTGKTAAFALPILHALLRKPERLQPLRVRALVLAPTRELAVQITESFRAYGRFMHLRLACVIGGAAIGPQARALAQGAHVLVATPGRLLDLLRGGKVRLDRTEFLVLDEADHMLDLGFILPIRDILARLPRNRQNAFFSATMPKEIASLAAEILNEPVEARAAPAAAPAARVVQEVILVDAPDKRDLLVELLGRPDFRRTIVFTRTKRGADRVSKHVEAAGIPAAAIHGDKSQNQRQRALDGFREGRMPVLVATDVAARGIDVDGVTHVVNFELPDVPEVYVHRIGRTARAGATGAAISLCADEESGLVRAIERLTRQELPVVDRRRADRPRPAARPKDDSQRSRAYGKPGARPPGAGTRRRPPRRRVAMASPGCPG